MALLQNDYYIDLVAVSRAISNESLFNAIHQESVIKNACMNDTSPEIERKVFEMIMARSGEERFMMGIRSFDAAREIVLASLPKDLPTDELKRRLFERIYGAPMERFVATAVPSLKPSR